MRQHCAKHFFFWRELRSTLEVGGLLAELQLHGGKVRPQLLPLCIARIRYGYGSGADRLLL